jgi:predicted dehydrogenase|tara:strand:- start:3947 stop:4951 length:1005 start_codon:yes stop_codon:yes gene_type:complete
MDLKNILIVGLGSIGLRHLRIAREIFPESRIAILRHQETKEIPKDANKVFHTLSDAIQFKPQIAIICTPASIHIEISMALVQEGVHVLIEKPISNKKEGLEELNNEAVKNNCVLMVGYNLRFLSSLNKFKNLIDNNFIGDLYSVRSEAGQYLPSWRDKDYRKTVSAKKSLGGGVLLELSHELDYLRWIFGDIEFVQAQLSKQSALDIDVEDTVHTIVTFKKNYKNINLIASLSLDFIRHDKVRICHVIGDKGSLRWNGLTGDIDLFELNSTEWKNIYKDEINLDQSYKEEWLHFIECINKKEYPRISFQDSVEVLNIIDSIKKASSSGKRVKVK